MRLQSLLMLGAFAAELFAQNFTPVSRMAAERYASAQPAAAVFNGPRPRISMWIWSDNYVYQAAARV